jgi:hypothetical protein
VPGQCAVTFVRRQASLAHHELGYFDLKTGALEPRDNLLAPECPFSGAKRTSDFPAQISGDIRLAPHQLDVTDRRAK